MDTSLWLKDDQTQLLHWKKEPDKAFEGHNQVSLYYDVSFPDVSRQQPATLQIQVKMELLNEAKGLIFRAISQTLFTLLPTSHPGCTSLSGPKINYRI